MIAASLIIKCAGGFAINYNLNKKSKRAMTTDTNPEKDPKMSKQDTIDVSELTLNTDISCVYRKINISRNWKKEKEI